MFLNKHHVHKSLSWLYHCDLLLRSPLVSWRNPMIANSTPVWTVIPMCNITMRPRHKVHISSLALDAWLPDCNFPIITIAKLRQSRPWHLRIRHKRIGGITPCGGLWSLGFTSTTNNLSRDALYGGKCDRHLMLVRSIICLQLLGLLSNPSHHQFISSTPSRIQSPKPATLFAMPSLSLSLHSR